MFAKRRSFLVNPSISGAFSSSAQALLKLQHTGEKRQIKIYQLIFSYTSHSLFFTALTVVLGGMLGFWANAGFFMRAGLLGFGDMVAGWASEEVSPFPSLTCSRGTPANS